MGTCTLFLIGEVWRRVPLRRTRDLLGRPAQDASLAALLQGSYLPYTIMEDPERKTVAVASHTGEVYSAEVLVVRRSLSCCWTAPGSTACCPAGALSLEIEIGVHSPGAALVMLVMLHCLASQGLRP